MVNKDRIKRKAWTTLLNKALEEMNSNQVVLLKRGDLFDDQAKVTYKKIYEELHDMHKQIKEGGDLQQAYRYLQLSVFNKEESFCMDLFQTKRFPVLFELFEYE